MSMTEFIGHSTNDEGVGVHVVANGGTVEVSLMGADGSFSTAHVYTQDSADIFKPCGFAFKFVATGGAVFSLSNAVSISA
jgi:hypothetical protein